MIALLQSGQVDELSLDHDLGDDARGTGYDVILWIEEAVALHGFAPPKIAVHSANSSATLKMRAGIATIERLVAQRQRPAGTDVDRTPRS
ncbi:cyclic-phosphate processing receiver domain-containing protein [Caballeronia sp. ATUFL_F1_KS39]|uniref:cyclic-phosphate processing receiver domain-containing protein n=1 Tax=Caballeronia sp. ATUFL_F1_KS39 TaxID=2921766 RepID=UPI0032EDFF51